MPLISCPECGRQISIAAEACPQCGHPNRPSKPTGPTCYACSAPATTRCQSCGALSCALHLQNIFVSRGHGGGAYELRCKSCYATAQAWQVVGFVIIGIILLFVAMFALGMLR
jgi:hypothetical protein